MGNVEVPSPRQEAYVRLSPRCAEDSARDKRNRGLRSDECAHTVDQELGSNQHDDDSAGQETEGAVPRGRGIRQREGDPAEPQTFVTFT